MNDSRLSFLIGMFLIEMGRGCILAISLHYSIVTHTTAQIPETAMNRAERYLTDGHCCTELVRRSIEMRMHDIDQ